MSERQTQKAGDNSQLVQVAGDFVQGVTLDQAFEVADLTARKVAAEEFAKADMLAMQRMELLNQRVIRDLDELKRLAVFGDPAFQVTLRKAQIGAACSDRLSDYDMLAKLLTDRATRGDQRTVRAGLDHAIEIVEKVDDAALAGLTVFQAATQYRPVSGSADAALNALEQLFGQLHMADLPSGPEWLDHLDILGAIRVSHLGDLKRFEEYISSGALIGLVALGVETGSEAEALAHERLAAVGIQLPVLDHELKPGYRRVAFCALDHLEKGLRQSTLEPDQTFTVVEVARDVYGLGQQDHALIEPLMAKLDEFPNLKLLREWWNSIPTAVQVTAVGRVLARANAIRLDGLKMLPPLD